MKSNLRKTNFVMAKNKQQKKQKMSNAVVLYQPRAAVAIKTQKQQKNKNRYKSRDEDILTYKAALMNPFAPAALGARVPDMFSVPTATRHLTRMFTLTTDSNGAFDCVVLPNMFNNANSTRGSFGASGSTWTAGDGTTITGGRQYTLTSSLTSQLRNYRIVGYGVRVSVVSSHDATAGRVVAATFPISSWVNEKTATIGGLAANSNNSDASPSNTLTNWGIPVNSSVVDVNAVNSMPNSVEVTAVRLAAQPIEITPKISTPEAFNFKESGDAPGGFQANNQTSVSYITTGDASYLRVAGFEAVVIAGSGLPVSTQCVDVEVIYHIEGIPNLISTTFAAGESTATVVNPVSWMSVIQQVSKLPVFRDVVTYGGNKLIPGLGTLASRYL